ncbi:hypothetical protein E4U42_007049 [Claviceps africana]|uniref:Uncharacterized protein n=1 Tax=Claviceps africana TaxID=83212 RepID=A0A8K0J1V1_9HYPO|nr:hypothetical protein E4U42_007049 [Claviceps africana]
MTSFFVHWELWQQMTFVLGCSILVVVLLGVFKLWLANRRRQAHEVIDEERRARIAEMNYCGIRHLNHNSIPFGARAIEQGQQVPGIWNSCRALSDASPATSTATMANDHENRPLQHDQVVYPRLHGIQEESARPASSSSLTDTHSSTPSSTYHDCRSMSHSEDDVDDVTIPPSQTDHHSRPYQPPKTDQVSLRGPSMTLASPLSNAVASGISEPLLNSTSAPRTPKGRAYGSAQVYANREHRNMNSGFEILPAGTLGARPEFHIQDRDPNPQQSDQKR